MSEEQTQNSVQDDQKEKGSAQEQAVSVKAYKEVSGDMHKYKTEAKELKMRMNELQAQLESQQKAKLEEEKRFEELYRQAEEDKVRLIQERQQEKQLVLRAIKKSALKSELGGSINDNYLNFAAFDEIEVNDDNSLNSETVRTVANKFRQEHPSLVPSSASGNITSSASSVHPNLSDTEKSVNQMSVEEIKQKLINN